MPRLALKFLILLCGIYFVYSALRILVLIPYIWPMFPVSSHEIHIAGLSLSKSFLNSSLQSLALGINISAFKSPKLTMDEKAAIIEKRTQNLPARFFYKVLGKMTGKNESCAIFPNIYRLNYIDTHWQKLETSDGPYYLYGAYYDNRPLAKLTPAVRIIGTIAKNRIKTTLFCQLWFEEFREPILVPFFDHRYILEPRPSTSHDGYLQPYMFSCQVPKLYTYVIPRAVSIVVKACDHAKNILKVNYILPPSGKKEEFAVCVKGIAYPFLDYSIRLVEWLELLFILGVHKVFLYDLDIHPNISKIINYYEKKGRVELTKIPLAGGQPNAFGLLGNYIKTNYDYRISQEVVPINDCFMKNIHRYKYISVLDIDEVIVPQSSLSWKTLMNSLIPKANEKGKLSKTSFNIGHVYFLTNMTPAQETVPDIPRYMHMLQHVYRSQSITPFRHWSEKSFIDTERVLIANNHFAHVCFGGPCVPYYVDTRDAYLQHYRENMAGYLIKFTDKRVVKDANLLRYKDALVSGVNNALLEMGFFEHLLPEQK